MLSPKPWRAELVLYSAVALFTSVCFGALTSVVLQHLGIKGFKDVDDFGNLIVMTVSIHGAAWVLMWVFLRMHCVTAFTTFGFRGPRIGRSLLLAIGIFAVILPAVLLIQAGEISVLTKLGWVPKNQAPVELFEQAQSWGARAYLGVWAVFFAPVAEEFIFRGVLYPFVKQLGFPKLAFFGTSFVFGLIHLDLVRFLPLFILALALTWLYEYTDNLLAPISVHILFNSTNLAMLALQHFGYIWPAS